MSIEARQALVNSHNIIFRSPEQRDDIVNLQGCQTQLICLLGYLVKNGALFEVTALKSDHHDDTCLNPVVPHWGTHAGGWAIDLWPLYKPEEGAYIDQIAPEFQHFLRLAAKAPFIMQIGLTPDAFTPLNIVAAGSIVFEDDGASHVHIGTQGH